MMSNFKKVQWFNELAGNEFGDMGIAAQMDLIAEEHSEVVDSVDQDELAKECIDLLYVTYGLLHRLGVDADQLFAEVNANNMSKFCANSAELSETVDFYQDKGLKVGVRSNGGVFAVYSEIDQYAEGKRYPKGKLLKPADFQNL